MVVGIIDHQTGTRDIRTLPALGRRVAVARGRRQRSRRRRWPACRSPPASSPRSSPTSRWPTHASAATAFLVAVVVVGSMLTVAYSARFYWGAFVGPRRRAPARPRSVRRRSRHRHGAFVRSRPRCLRSVGVVLGVVPRLADSAGDGLRARARHGGDSAGAPLALARLEPAARAVGAHPRRWPALFVLVDRWLQSARWRRAGRCRAAPRCTSRCCAASRVDLRPGHGLRAERIAAGVRRRHPRDGRGPPGMACSRGMGLVGMARRVRHASRDVPIVGFLVVAALGAAIVRRRFSAAVFLGVAGYAMAGLFVAVGRARPRAHAGRGRDAVDRRVRPRAAPPPRAIRATVDAPSPRRPARDRGRRRRDGVRVRARGRRSRLPASVSGEMVAARGSRRPRPQRRERDPRRLPRLRHPRRDHRARGRVDRCGRAGPGRPPCADERGE